MDLFDDLPPPKKTGNAYEKNAKEFQDAPKDGNVIDQEAKIKSSEQPKTNWGPQLFKPVIRKAPKAKKILFSFSKQKDSAVDENLTNETTVVNSSRDEVLSAFDVEDLSQDPGSSSQVDKEKHPKDANKAANRSVKHDPSKPILPNKAILSTKNSLINSRAGTSTVNVPTSWTTVDFDQVPIENKPISNINNSFLTSGKLKYDADQGSNDQNYHNTDPKKSIVITSLKIDLKEFLPETPGLKKNFNKSSKKSRFVAGSSGAIEFDENEIYNPEFPNNYMIYKSWVSDRKKSELEAYFQSMKDKNNSEKFTKKHKKRKNDSDKSYSSDSTVNDYGQNTSENTSSNLETSSQNQIYHAPPASIQTASTGEEAYLARLKLSQKLQSPNNATKNTMKVPDSMYSNNSVQKSKRIVLKNVAEAGKFDKDMKDDILSECSRFGTVINFSVSQTDPSKNSTVLIYIEFSSFDSSNRAIFELDKRIFDGREIAAEYFYG
ncbi:DNA-damage-repair/toleration protein [Smittium culicis]|uniref:DNA-damage-repair/toleration protein n=1 Tax=Smittium culicis TaxID=133412 RepID=A0A1R1YJ76_9FUNG|nr:DNA-damage-repair/toleration protein [Smittium culicis]